MIHYQGIDAEIPAFLTIIDKEWIDRVIAHFKKKTGEVFFLFCTDEYLYQMNVNFLQHDTYTDIITFDQSADSYIVRGELYISVERVKDNASRRGIEWSLELRRVMVHGILHLIGFNDKSRHEQLLMRTHEDFCLSLLPEEH